jgi:hypothetical protein
MRNRNHFESGNDRFFALVAVFTANAFLRLLIVINS